MDSIYILYLIAIIIFIWIAVAIIIFIWIAVAIRDKKKEEREFTELQETPIEVYRYTYRVYLNDGNSYIRLANAFCSVDFNEFVERILLNDATLEITKEVVLNTENITKVELVSKETKIIKPKVNKHYDSFWLSKGYSVYEVEERGIKE